MEEGTGSGAVRSKTGTGTCAALRSQSPFSLAAWGLPVLTVVLGLPFGGCKKRQTRPNGPAGGGLPTTATSTGIEMVCLPGGEFVMGDPAGGDDEKPARRVSVSAIWMDKTEVTQKAFRALMGRNPSKFKAPDRPVERISWHAATQYCNARSLRESLTPCYDLKTLECDFGADGYRLPTEAEWEYACRAGSDGAYSFGPDAAALADHAWFKANAQKTTHPVGRKRPNAWGLYDMHGNVAEWCGDYYAEAAYKSGAEAVRTDPRGPSAGEERVLRGGSWRTRADACRCSARYSEEPGFADVCFGYEAYGFRCVRKAAGALLSAPPSAPAPECSVTRELTGAVGCGAQRSNHAVSPRVVAASLSGLRKPRHPIHRRRVLFPPSADQGDPAERQRRHRARFFCVKSGVICPGLEPQMPERACFALYRTRIPC